MKKLNLAILGAGGIASAMAETVRQMEDVNLYAAASRDAGRARAFAETYGAQKWYGSYEEMVRDDGVDLVYIATPHSHHCAHTRLCIGHGRPVLCEKAFARNAQEAKEMVALSRKKGVFLAEAMWVRYAPMSRMLKELVDSGRIGKIVGLTANLGYSLMHVERVLRPELAGGALLDLGVYTMNFATWILGDGVAEVSSTVTMHETGVDRSEFVNLRYPDGTVAGLFQTMQAVTDRRGIIYGTEGRIEVENINNYQSISVFGNNREVQEFLPCPPQISGYEYEVRACKRALEDGKLECEEMPHSHTIRIMELLDEIRKGWK